MKVYNLKIIHGSINLRKLTRPAVLCISVLLVMSMIITLYPTQAATVTPLGNAVIGTIVDQTEAGAQSVSYFTCIATGSVTDIVAYIDGASSGNAMAALYAVGGGSASALLEQSNSVSIGTSFSWVDFQLTTPYTITSGTTYGLAIMGNVPLNIRLVTGTGQRTGGPGYNSYTEGFTNPFGTIWFNDFTGAMSIYATYTSSTTPTATPTPTPTPEPTATSTSESTATLTLSATLESQITGTNIVQNGGFESGISPWTLAISDPRSQGYAGTLTRSSNAYLGSYSGLFTVTGNPQRGSGYIAMVQTIPAQAGQTYTLQLYYKGSVTIGPHVFCFDSSWNNLGLFIGPALLPASTWTPMTMTFSVPSGTAATEIHFDVASTGVFQVDNIIATNPTSSPSPSPTPTRTPTPSSTPTPTVTSTPTPSPTPKPTATPTPTPSPTPKPTTTPTPTPSPTPKPTTTPTPTATPTPIPTGTYTYIVSVSGSNYQMKNGATGQVIYQSANAAQVINNAVGNLTQGNSILVNSGTYTLKASITATNKNGITLNFDSGATLFVANGVNTGAIFLTGCNNWLIKNPTINGNAANQADGGWPPVNGITIYNHCSNILVDGATIDNCRMYGFIAWSDVTNCGIKNSKVTNCGWNCIQLGNDVMAISTETGLYAINNECAYCSDVGITTYGIGNTIQGNYIHDIYGTAGYINSQWGIGVEGGHGHTITGNTLVNCPRGMSIEQTDGVGSNTITGNTITTCGFGVVVVSPNNTITNNTISNFDMYGWSQQAIVIEGSYGGANNNKVLDNTISSTNTVAHAIHINSADDTQFTGNKIVVPRVGTSWYAIQVSDSSRTTISRNTIIGFMAIIIDDATCQSNTITNNDLTKSNAETGAIANHGTGTIINGNLT